MSLKDRFDKFIDYFTEDGVRVQDWPADLRRLLSKPELVQPKPIRESKLLDPICCSRSPQPKPQPQQSSTEYYQTACVSRNWLNTVQMRMKITLMFVIERYERRQSVDLLLANESILIDFQYMTEVRKLDDYLDGARYVLAGNLKKLQALCIYDSD